MRTNFTVLVTEYREVAYTDVPRIKAKILARGFKVDEIQVSHNHHNDTYRITATHIK